MPINRKRFLENACWTTAGTALGFLGRPLLVPPPPEAYAAPLLLRPSAPPPPAAEPNPASKMAGQESFSQCGEDLNVSFTFHHRGIGNVTYLDIGANDPIELNNTYFFYRLGYRGVLVEPNPAYGDRLKSVRPRDTTLVAGIGVTAAREADFYVLSAPALSTFSEEEAQQAVKLAPHHVTVQDVIKVPLLNINEVMDKHFKGAPTFVSIDTEGMDLAILKTIDFARFRPKVICAETLAVGTTRMIPETAEFMVSQGYVVRGGSLVNTIFIDSKIL
jgi:FkbM family methyltransferase